jgi:hypothetical protein
MLKAQFKRQGTEFKEVKIGRDITVEAFKEEYPDVRAVPHIVESGE